MDRTWSAPAHSGTGGAHAASREARIPIGQVAPTDTEQGLLPSRSSKGDTVSLHSSPKTAHKRLWLVVIALSTACQCGNKGGQLCRNNSDCASGRCVQSVTQRVCCAGGDEACLQSD